VSRLWEREAQPEDRILLEDRTKGLSLQVLLYSTNQQEGLNKMDTPTFDYLNFDGLTVTLNPELGRYSNGRLAISFVDRGHGENWATVTINMPNDHLNPGEVFIKDWSENELIVRQLVLLGWLVDTGRNVVSGFVFPAVMRPAGQLAEFIDAHAPEAGN
jgi:hypothetical protein